MNCILDGRRRVATPWRNSRSIVPAIFSNRPPSLSRPLCP